MRFIIAVLLWTILAVLCWPAALILLVALPFLWLVSLPFRLAAAVLKAAFVLIGALFFLPIRLLR